MNSDIGRYEEAVMHVEYINMVRRTIIALFDRLTEAGQSGMFISQSAYTHAVDAIDEIIKEMYYYELSSAYEIIRNQQDII